MTIVQQGYLLVLTTYSFLFIWNLKRSCLFLIGWALANRLNHKQYHFSGRNFNYEQDLATLPQAIVFEMVEQSSCALTYVFVTNKTISLLTP